MCPLSPTPVQYDSATWIANLSLSAVGPALVAIKADGTDLTQSPILFEIARKDCGAGQVANDQGICSSTGTQTIWSGTVILSAVLATVLVSLVLVAIMYSNMVVRHRYRINYKDITLDQSEDPSKGGSLVGTYHSQRVRLVPLLPSASRQLPLTKDRSGTLSILLGRFRRSTSAPGDGKDENPLALQTVDLADVKTLPPSPVKGPTLGTDTELPSTAGGRLYRGTSRGDILKQAEEQRDHIAVDLSPVAESPPVAASPAPGSPEPKVEEENGGCVPFGTIELVDRGRPPFCMRLWPLAHAVETNFFVPSHRLARQIERVQSRISFAPNTRAVSTSERASLGAKASGSIGRFSSASTAAGEVSSGSIFKHLASRHVRDIVRMCRFGRTHPNIAILHGYCWFPIKSSRGGGTVSELYLVEEFSELGTLQAILESKAVLLEASTRS